jgi:hypothetical protein
MKQQIPVTFLLLFLAMQPKASLAQGSVSAAVKNDLANYHAQRLEEEIYLRTDKESYLAGEICWFKLYVLDPDQHRPLDLSKVAYVEWLDKDNHPVLQAKIGLSQGDGSGSLYLPLTLHSGNYKLRAYTSWMKNYSADGFFEKMVTVVNARKSAEIPVAPVPLQYSTVFFPEGGNLVQNITSQVAFKVTDQYGRGVECTGVITEDDQDTVVRFRPWRFGIGHFALTPRAGHRYRSTVRLADGTAISTLLPSAYPQGMVMSVSQEDTAHFRVNVQSTASGSDIYLVAHTRQSVKLAEAATLKEGKASFLVDKHTLGEGISHLTIFNAERQPICERLVFTHPAHQLHIAISTDKEKYATRKPIQLKVGSTGNDDRPLMADCSLAVFRLDSLQKTTTGDISTWLWLTSDLKGKIESPEYYFDHPEDEQAIDNLMISHGWRRFRWEEVLHRVAPSFDFPPEYNGAIISGKIVDTRTSSATGKFVQGYLSVPGSRTQFASAYCDSTGQIKFEMKDFYGGQEVIAQTDPTVDSFYRVDITNPFSESYADGLLPPFSLSPYDSATLSEKSLNIQVLNRYGGERLKQFLLSGFDSSAFYLYPDHSYLLDDYTRFTTMEEVMREYVVMMLVKKKGPHYHLPVYDLPNNGFFDDDPLILLDGVPVFNIDSLMVVDPLKVRKLDMVQRRFFLGSTSYQGIMNWITYKGDLGGYVLDPHATVVDYEGLQLQREFYSPSYATEEQAASHLPDFRNVLYWCPAVPQDSTAKSTLSFYSSDLPGKYVVVVEGLTAGGDGGSGITSFEVQQTP